jgi:hypothetical protein
MARPMPTAVSVIRAVGSAGIIVIALAWLWRIDLPVWLGAPIWAFVILAVVGTIGQTVSKLRREPAPSPTGGAPEMIEIGQVGQQWIHVLKLLRDHSVIEKRHELPTRGSSHRCRSRSRRGRGSHPATDRTWRRRSARRLRPVVRRLTTRTLAPKPALSLGLVRLGRLRRDRSAGYFGVPGLERGSIGS